MRAGAQSRQAHIFSRAGSLYSTRRRSTMRRSVSCSRGSLSKTGHLARILERMLEVTTLHGLCGGQIPMSSEWNQPSRNGSEKKDWLPPVCHQELVTPSDRGASKMWRTRMLAARSSDV